MEWNLIIQLLNNAKVIGKKLCLVSVNVNFTPEQIKSTCELTNFCFVLNFHLNINFQQHLWLKFVSFFIHLENLFTVRKKIDGLNCKRLVLHKVCCSRKLLVILSVLHQLFHLKRLWNFYRNVCDLQLLPFVIKTIFLVEKVLVSSNNRKVEKSPLWYKSLVYLIIIKDYINLSWENISVIKKNHLFHKTFHLTSLVLKYDIAPFASVFVDMCCHQKHTVTFHARPLHKKVED